MKISHGHAEGKPTTEVGETFTGTVLRDPVLSGDGAPTINSVTFPPGARTNWHNHSEGQILIITSGRGRVATRAGHHEILEPGDVVWIAPGEDHWHGAGPDSVMAHIAISLGTSEWGDPVSDEER